MAVIVNVKEARGTDTGKTGKFTIFLGCHHLLAALN
jgi:hypothetical protein